MLKCIKIPKFLRSASLHEHDEVSHITVYNKEVKCLPVSPRSMTGIPAFTLKCIKAILKKLSSPI